LSEGCEPLISRQDAPSGYPTDRAGCRSELPRERFSALALLGNGAASGFRLLRDTRATPIVVQQLGVEQKALLKGASRSVIIA
jgi:hypothetical protein